MMNFRTLGAVICGLVLFVGRVVVSGADANSATLQREWVRTYRLDAGKTNVSLKMLPVADGVVVAGVSAGPSGDLDYLVIKYKANGDEGWMRRFDAEAGTQDVLRDLAVDPMANVFVTGTSKTVKYSRDGIFRWAAPFGGRAVAAGTNFVYVTGFSETNFATVQLRNDDTVGEQGWVRTFDGGWVDISHTAALSESDEVIVAGSQTVPRGARDFAANLTLIKYATNGSQRWVSASQRGTFFTGVDTEARKIAFDAEQSIFVMGTHGPWGQVARFSAAGVHQWTFGPHSLEHTRGIALGSDGSVVIVGTAIVKLRPDKTYAWEHVFTNISTRLQAVVTVGNGDIYAAGQEDSANGDINSILVKVNSDGFRVWADVFDSPHHGHDVASEMVVDALGSIYVTGFSATEEGGSEFVTIKYSPRAEIVTGGNGLALLRFHTKPGVSYALEATTNLLDWRSVMTNTADTNGLVQFQSADGGWVPYRIYRGKTTK